MSIATEITRLQTAKAEIKQAIEDKGVTVGDGLIDTYAGKIGEISTGDNYYDTFWDAFQDNGNRKAYNNAFRTQCWNDVNFKPKYKMYPTNAAYMFESCGITDLDIGDYVDFSKCSEFGYAFCRSKFRKLPVINLTGHYSTLLNTFSVMPNLVSIEKLIVDFDTGITFHSNTFNSSSKLTEIRFEGVIKKDIYLDPCPLSVESMKDVISHLANHKDTDNEGFYTIKFSSSCWEALEASGAAPDGGTWQNYVNDTLGWLT